MLKFKGIFVLFTFLLSFVACNYVSAEPATPPTPEEYVLQHIMSVGNCNEVQAFQILAIMANRSVNHDGFGFYVKYLMGNDTEAQEQFKSIRYHDYYVFWEDFLKEWANKSSEDKAVALQINTPSEESTNKTLDNMNSEEAGLVIDRITPVLNKVSRIGTVKLGGFFTLESI